MTENQRNYLADLAGQKGIQLKDTDNWPVAKASEEIERLKAMPDATFDEISAEQEAKINQGVDKSLNALWSWGFDRRGQ